MPDLFFGSWIQAFQSRGEHGLWDLKWRLQRFNQDYLFEDFWRVAPSEEAFRHKCNQLFYVSMGDGGRITKRI